MASPVYRLLRACALILPLAFPLVIEEMFPLSCSMTELGEFIEKSRKIATGWIGFYWGETIDEYQKQKSSVADGLTLEWLEYFRKTAPEILMLKTMPL